MADALLTPEQFAQSIKAKYPDYDSVPDAELAAKMLEKYPEYRARVQAPKPADTSILDKFVSMLPGKDAMVNALPAVGGAAGGVIGGMGGTVAGMGVGGVPGAIGGATVGGSAGEALKQLVNFYREKPSPTSTGQAATDIGTEGAIQGAMEAGGQVATKALAKGGEMVYRGYLKPSLSKVNLPKATQIVKDAIAANLPVTAAGAARAQQMISELNAQVEDVLSKATGKTVDLSEIANRVRDYANKTFNRAGRDPRDFEAAMKVADRIDNHPSMALPPGVQGPRPAPVADLPTANTVKRDLQGAARDKFGVPGGTAETQTEKYSSATMRKAIEGLAPEVGPLNAQQSRLIDVARSLNQAIGREGNQSAVNGVKTMASVMAGGAEYQKRKDPVEAMATALALRAGLTPAVATRAAILAVKLGENVPGTAVADVARAAVQAVSQGQQ